MPLQNVPLLSFNRGLITKLALARTDLKRTALSAEIQTNYIARSLGSMMLRPGAEYKGSTRSNLRAIHIPFVDDSGSTLVCQLIEVTDSSLRFRDGNDDVIERGSVSSVILNGNFDTDLSDWIDTDEAGATSAWVTGGYMGLTGTGVNVALRTQQVTVALGDRGLEHALRINIYRGPVKIRVGSSAGDDDYIREVALPTGEYSLAFTPTTNFHIWLFSDSKSQKLVTSIQIETPSEMVLPAPWSSSNLDDIRWDTSADVIYVACKGVPPQKIMHFGERSWGIGEYLPEDGPFRTPNTSSVWLQPSALNGNVEINSSFRRFQPTQVGALIKITSIGQNVDSDLAGNGQWTDPIKVTGVGTTRNLTIVRAGTWTGTLQLQRSVGEVGSWENISTTYTTNGSTTFNDGYDNQIIYYRLGFESGYGSGTAEVSMSYASGGLTGIARITEYVSATKVNAEVIQDFGSITSSVLWSEGEWSDFRGWPTAVALHEGRLWWAGKDKIWGSVSDAYESFDEDVEGDSGPISRSVGSGAVAKINWLLSLVRLAVGARLDEKIAKSSSLDEPLSPTNFNLRSPSTQGSANVQAVKVDSTGLFVQRGGTRLMQLSFADNPYSTIDYSSSDLSIICPEIGDSGITRIAIQDQPDRRLHCVRSDGKVAIMVYDKAEDVKCWQMYETDGAVEDVVTLPGDFGGSEDRVYYVVRRTINGQTVRYLEKWALESECVGGTVNKQADSFYEYSGVSTTTITGLSHLEGESVVVWGDGRYIGTATVSGGSITLGSAVSRAIVGLPYTAQYKSTKLAYAAGLGTALTQPKEISKLGLLMVNTHASGVTYGQDFDNMDDMPGIEDGAVVDTDYIWVDYDKEPFEFPGDWNTDSRLCLQSVAPKPANIAAAIVSVMTNDEV